MPKRTADYHSLLLKDLANPLEASHYLNAALDDSDELFLVALRDVAEAFQMSKVAAEAGISRESIYRMLTRSGNPTYRSLTGILRALNLEIAVKASGVEQPGNHDGTTITSDTGTEAGPMPAASINDNVVSIEIGRHPRRLHIAQPPMAESYDFVGSRAGTGP